MKLINDWTFTYIRGRVALAAILRGLGVGPDDQVAVQAFTCLAVADGITATGARPLWIDISSDSLTMDPGSLAERITPRTRAIVVQHTYGLVAPLTELRTIADRYGIPVVEDCCHIISVPSTDSTGVSNMGVASFFSFEWGKPAVAGLGGLAKVNCDRLRDTMSRQYGSYRLPSRGREMRINGQYAAFRLAYRPRFYWQVRRAYRSLSQAGLLEPSYTPRSQTDSLREYWLRMPPSLVRRAKRQVEYYERHVEDISGQIDAYSALIRDTNLAPLVSPGMSVSLCRFPVRSGNKERLLALSSRRGVEVASWYQTPVHPLSGSSLTLVNYLEGSCPNAESACETVVSMPLRPGRDRTHVLDFGKLLGTESL